MVPPGETMIKSAHLKFLKRLEGHIKQKLMERKMYTLKHYPRSGYCLDKDGFITGLNLYGLKEIDLSILEELPYLSVLILANSSLEDISPLASLTFLTSLKLSSNRITDVSPLASLSHLTELNLWNNQITDISPLETLRYLTSLDVSNNRITHLPKWAVNFKGEIKWDGSIYLGKPGLYLKENPIQAPPIEIVKEGKKAVINYFNELEQAEKTVQFLHAKLLLVGQGDVGKTTLMKKLLYPEYQPQIGGESTTEGIDIQPWSIDCALADGETKTITLNLWDFGGQEIYHATHQFFLTKRSIYLLVWDPRKNQNQRQFDYWLEIIKLLGGGSPVIMVMNKADIRTIPIDEKSFTEKYPNIHRFLRTSCLDNTGLDTLTSQVKTSLAGMPHLSDKVPAVWRDIRDTLEKAPRDYISMDDYYAICRRFGLNAERAGFLSSYLHDLGVILHFQADPVLAETVILKPHWATNALYKLIDTAEIIEAEGSFSFGKLQDYWDRKTYPRAIHRHLVRLMERFELCFQLGQTENYFIPELLSPGEPPLDIAKYREPGVLRFQYHYPFMPEGIISRFIARLPYLIYGNRFWRYGVELCFEKTTALVRSLPRYNRVTVAISGPCRTKLLGIIQSNLQHIHETLNMERDTHYVEKIPCHCKTCKTLDTPHFYKYGLLKRKYEKKRPTACCDISLEDVSVEALLADYLPPQREKSLLEAIRQAAMELTGIAKNMNRHEDSRTGFICKMLKAYGFEVEEQARWGRSGSGESIGRVDLKITIPDTGFIAVVEAFNLSYCTKREIDDHLTRVFYYDPLGSKENYILVYAEGEEFSLLWEKYLAYLSQRQWGEVYPLLSGPEIKGTPWAEIKHAITRHDREKEETALHHLFANLRPKTIVPCSGPAGKSG